MQGQWTRKQEPGFQGNMRTVYLADAHGFTLKVFGGGGKGRFHLLDQCGRCVSHGTASTASVAQAKEEALEVARRYATGEWTLPN